jgi:hypothetical protein
MNTKCIDSTIVNIGYDFGGIRRVDKHQSYYYVDTNCRASQEFTAYMEGYHESEPAIAIIFKAILFLPALVEILADDHPFAYDDLSYRACYGGNFVEGMAYVTDVQGEVVRFGYIDESFKLTVPCEYETALDFRRGTAVVSKNGKYGLIGKNNEQITGIIFRSYDYYGNDLVMVEPKKSLYYMIRTDGTRVGPEFTWYKEDYTGFAVKAKDGKYYKVTESGEFVFWTGE